MLQAQARREPKRAGIDDLIELWSRVSPTTFGFDDPVPQRDGRNGSVRALRCVVDVLDKLVLNPRMNGATVRYSMKMPFAIS
jgi:hypothetical protein